MMINRKRFLIALGSLFFICLSLFAINDSRYFNYKNTLILYANNVEKVVAKGANKEHYSDHLKKYLKRSGLKNIVIKMSGENLYGIENSVYIEATPPPTKLDRLIHREVKPIWVEYTFINGIDKH